ncbi:Hint domain-containing protein [Roseovarius arcticus]|uniref:Hint domain-containing protein n=1 Tax=Roseovarius arcticus TaxID=2547404 RepID=UPI001FE4FB35|nr:Hint domain-containing protein [Roseovarius arcticus]
MPTFTIVDKDKDPLGPNEINAGGTIHVNDGDVFVFDSTADSKTTFQSASGSVTDFSVQINDSNPNKFDIDFKDNLSPTITIADNADLSDIKIDADKAESVQLTAGDNVTLGEYKGSKDGADTLVIGDDFTTLSKLKTEGGDDSISIGDRANIEELDTGKGNDSITIGDDFNGKKIKTDDGDDIIRLGANATLDEVDGGKGNDVLITQSPGVTGKNTESINVVCFARGTLIRTATGERPVEDLVIGDLVLTADNGLRPIGWIGARALSQTDLEQKAELRPIRFRQGALGEGLPAMDLVVSPQHRILFRSRIAERMFGNREVLVAARMMLGLPGVEIVETSDGVTYFHFMFDAHEVVFANSSPTESMFAGPQAILALDAKARAEIAMLFPELLSADTKPVPARPFPGNGRLARKLVDRHVANNRSVVA